jgi:hypothetical protein
MEVAQGRTRSALRVGRAMARLLWRGTRALLRPRNRGAGGPAELPYRDWLELHVRAQAKARRVRPRAGWFSILTCVYDGSPVPFLEEAARSVFGQTWPHFEWVLFDNGCSRPELTALLARLRRDSRVRCLRAPHNLGILPAMRRSLEHATGQYVIPLDADDLLLPDALHAIARAIVEHGSPPFVYSDEDVLVDGLPQAPYCRPDWDPVLNLCSSYAFHLCAFQRQVALDLGVYSNEARNWCQDWDAITRFSAAGVRPLHLPQVLYHWRMHPASSTNRPDPEKGSLFSQRHLLQGVLDRRPDGGLFEVQPFPIFRGCPEWWVRRRRERPDPLQVLLLAGGSIPAADALQRLVAETAYPFAHLHVIGAAPFAAEDTRRLVAALQAVHDRHQTGRDAGACLSFWPWGGLPGLVEAARQLEEGLALVWSDEVRPEGDEWPWEATALCRLHPDTVLVSGRILNPDRIVVAGGEVFGVHGILGCPDRGRPASDPGYWALALKQKSVSAVHPAFFLADARFLREALAALPGAATLPFLGAWLGARAAERDRRVVFSPLVTAVAGGAFTGLQQPGPDERERFLREHGCRIPDTRWYSPLFCRDAGAAYRLRKPADRS